MKSSTIQRKINIRREQLYQRDFLADGADLILLSEITIEILFCLKSTLENCLI